MSFIEEEIVKLTFDGEDFGKKVEASVGAIHNLTGTIQTFCDKSSGFGSKLESIMNGINGISTVMMMSGNDTVKTMGVALTAATNLTSTLNKQSQEVDMSPIVTQTETVSQKFSALGTVIEGVFLKLGMQIESTATSFLKKISVDQVSEGWEKFGQIMKATQTTLATGASLDDTELALQRLSWYADETSYSLTDMTSSIAKFTSYGIAIEDAAKEIMGIDNAVAKAGGTISMATSAQQAFQRAFSQGYMSLSVWRRQLTTSGLITQDFKEKCIEAGLAVGTLYEDANGKIKSVNKDMEVTATGMENTLTKTQWMTKDVMELMLKGYAESSTMLSDAYNEFAGEFTTSEIMAIAKANNLADEYSLSAFRMAQEATTMAQAIESIYDAASTQWNNVFKNIFGNFYEARRLFTEIANWSVETFVGPVYTLVDFTKEAFEATVDWSEFYRDAGESLSDFIAIQEDENEQLFVTNNYHALIADSIYNIFRAIDSYITTFKAAWSTVFNSVSIEQAQGLVKLFHDFTEGMILSEDQMVKLGTVLQSIFIVIKTIKNVLAEIVTFLTKNVLPVIKEVASVAYDAVVSLLEQFNALSNTNSIFKKISGGVKDIRNAIVNAGDDGSGATERLIKYLKEYNGETEEAVDNTEDLNTSTGKIKEITKQLNTFNWDNLTSADVSSIDSMIESLKECDDYMSMAEVKGKAFSDALATISSAGEVTAEDIDTLKDALKEIEEATSNTKGLEEITKLKEEYSSIDWDNPSSGDLSNLKDLVKTLEQSDGYLDSVSEAGKDFIDVLDDISEQGYATASDIEKLNNAIDDMNDKLYESNDYRTDTNDKAAIMYKALASMKADGVITDAELEALEKLQKELEDTTGYTNSTSAAVKALEDVLSEMADGGQVTAEDVEGISDAIASLRSSAESDSGITKINEEYSEATEGIENLLNTMSSSGKVTKKQVTEFEELYEKLYAATGEYWRLGQYYRKMDSILKNSARTGKISEEQLESLTEAYSAMSEQAESANAKYVESLYGDKEIVANIQTYSDNVTKLENTTEKLADTTENTNDNVSDLTKTISDESKATTESTKEVTDAVKDEGNAVEETSEKVDDANDSLDAFNEIASSTKEALSPIINAFKALQNIFAKISENKTIGNNGTGEKSFLESFGDYLKSINTDDLINAAIGVIAAVKILKMVANDLEEIAVSDQNAIQAAGAVIESMAGVAIKLAAAIAIITAADWAFGGAGDAVQSIVDIIKVINRYLIKELLLVAVFKPAQLATIPIIISILALSLDMIAGAIAIVSRFDGMYLNAADSVKNLTDTVKIMVVLISALSAFAKEESEATVLASAAVMFALAISIGAIGAILSLLMKIDSTTHNADKLTNDLKSIVGTLGELLTIMLMFSSKSDAKMLYAASNCFTALGVATLAVASAIAIVSVFSGINKNSSDAIESLTKCLTYLNESVLEMLILAKIFNSNPKLIISLGECFVALSVALIAVGAAITIVTRYGNTISSATDAVKALTDCLAELSYCLIEAMAVIGICKNNPDQIYSIAVCYVAIGVCLIAIGEALSIVSCYTFTSETVKPLTDCLSELQWCMNEVLAITGLFDNTPEQILTIAACYVAIGILIVTMGAAISLISKYAGVAGGAKEAVASLVEVLRELEWFLAEIIAIGGILDSGPDVLKNAAACFAALGAVAIAIGAAIVIISLVDYAAAKKSAKLLNDCLYSFTECIAVIIILTKIFNSENSASMFKDLAYSIAAISIPILAIGATLGIMAYVGAKYGPDTVEKSVDSITQILKQLGWLAFMMVLGNFNIPGVGLVNLNNVGILSGSNRWISQLGTTLIKVAAAIAIVAAVSNKFGPDAVEQASESIIKVLETVGTIMAALVGISAFINGKYSTTTKWYKKKTNTTKNIVSEVGKAMVSFGECIILVSVAISVLSVVAALCGKSFITAVNELIYVIIAIGVLMTALILLAETMQSAKGVDIEKNLKAISKTMGALVISLVAVSACIAVLAIVGKYTGAVGFVGAIAAVLFSMILLVELAQQMANAAAKIGANIYAVKGLNKIVLSLAASVLIISIAISILSNAFSKDADATIKAIITAAGVVAVFAGVIVIICVASKKIADAIITIGAALELSSKGLIAAGIFFAVLAGSLVGVAYAIQMIALAYQVCKKEGVAKATIESLVVILAAIGGLIYIIAANGTIISANVGGLLACSIFFAIVSTSLIAVAYAIQMIALAYQTCNKEGITAQTITTLAAVLLGFAGLIMILSKIAEVNIKGILVLSAAIAIISLALTGTAGAIRLLAIALDAMNKINLFTIAGGLAVFGASLLAVAAGFVAIAATGLLATKAVPGLLAISAVMISLGAAVLLVSIALSSLFNKTLDFSSTISNLKTQMGEIANTVTSTSKQIADNAYADGRYTTSGYASGVEDGTNDVYAATEKMAKAAEEGTTDTLDINSPSKVFGTYGKYTVEGYVDGVNSNVYLVNESGQAIGKMATDGTITAIDEADPYGIGGDYVGDIVDGTNDNAYSLTDATKRCTGNALDAAGKEANDKAYGIGDGIMTNAATGMESAAKTDEANSKTNKPSFLGCCMEVMGEYASKAVSAFKTGWKNAGGEDMLSSLSIDTDGLTSSLTEGLTASIGNIDSSTFTDAFDGVLEGVDLGLDTDSLTSQFTDSLTSSLKDSFSGITDSLDLSGTSLSVSNLGIDISSLTGTTTDTDTTDVTKNLTTSLTNSMSDAYSDIDTTEVVSSYDSKSANTAMYNYGTQAGTSYARGTYSYECSEETHAAGRALGKMVANGIASAKTLIISAGSTMARVLGNALENGSSILSDISQTIAKTFSENLLTNFTERVSGIKQKVTSRFAEIGNYINSGLISGIKNKISGIKDTAISLGSTFLSKFCSFFRIASPSKVMYENGNYIVEGLINGIKSGLTDVEGSADGISNPILSSIKSIGSMMREDLLEDLSISPTITPVLDMSNIDKNSLAITAWQNASSATGTFSSRVLAMMANSNVDAATQQNVMSNMNKIEEMLNSMKPDSSGVTYIQNNYSPKALSATEIYRRTHNQLRYRNGN